MEIKTKVLQDAVAKVLPFVPQKSPLAALLCFLLEAHDGTLEITGGSMKSTCRITVPCDGELRVLVCAKVFAADVSAIRESETIKLEVKDNRLVLKSKGHTAKFPLNDPDNYFKPALHNEFVPVDPSLLTALKVVGVAINETQSVHVLTGGLLTCKNGTITAFGTNSICAARYVCDGVFGQDFSVVIPKSSITNLSRAIGDATELWFSNNQTTVAFKTQDTVITTQLLDGQYPNMDHFFAIPPERTEAVVDSELLADALKRALMFAGDTHVIAFEVGDNEIVLSSASQEAGSSNFSIEAQCSRPSTVSFNGTFVLDFLRLFKGNVTLNLGSDRDKGLFWFSDIPNFIYLAMPIKLA